MNSYFINEVNFHGPFFSFFWKWFFFFFVISPFLKYFYVHCSNFSFSTISLNIPSRFEKKEDLLIHPVLLNDFAFLSSLLYIIGKMDFCFYPSLFLCWISTHLLSFIPMFFYRLWFRRILHAFSFIYYTYITFFLLNFFPYLR